MSEEPRPLRDILAECLRRELIGLAQPLWADWCRFDNIGGPEQWRIRADHLLRLLGENGATVARVGEAKAPAPAPTSPIIYRFKLTGRTAERIIRRGPGDQWQIAVLDGEGETIEQSFSIAQALINGGAVLTDDPTARSIPGLGRQLAALNEIYRLDAAGMEGTDA